MCDKKRKKRVGRTMLGCCENVPILSRGISVDFPLISGGWDLFSPSGSGITVTLADHESRCVMSQAGA